VNLDYAFFLAHLEQYQLLLCSSERPTAVFRIKALRDMPWRLRLLPELGANALDPPNSGGVSLIDATSKASGFVGWDGFCGCSCAAVSARATADRTATLIGWYWGMIRKALIR
jgi:hypothetical protein